LADGDEPRDAPSEEPSDERAERTGDGRERSRARRPGRVRMTSADRREQLIDVSRSLFASRGFEGTSVEEIAARAQVSKPVVYEHFGGKEGLYAVVVDREVRTLLDGIRGSLTSGRQRELIEQAAMALLDYIESNTDGFRILARDSSVASTSGSFATILSDIASQVEGILVEEFKRRGLDPKTAPMYAQMLVGMVALTGQWWLDARKPKKPEVAAHLVNLAWNGLSGLEARPKLLTSPKKK
jgi:AcrR family transcriptional regulator